MATKSFFFVLLCFVTCYGTNTDNISRIGNAIRSSVSGVDVAGATFLQRDVVMTEGVVFAYSAYFRSDKPVRFQIWRPEENDTNASGGALKHHLVAETRVTPSVVLSREDVYIESRLTEKCIRVRQGDRLGLMFEEAPGSVSYVFNDQTPTTFGNRLENVSDPYTAGDVVSFDALLFPYDFSAAAHVDTDSTHYANAGPGDLVDCYSHVLIPTYPGVESVTTALPTGAPGATGATGPQGVAGFPGLAGTDGGMGATGPIGAAGSVGATGARGEPGASGEQGPAGETVYVEAGVNTSGDAFYAKAEMSLSYLIWLIILSVFIIVILIIVVILIVKQRRGVTSHGASPAAIDAYTRTRFPSNPSLDEVEKSSACWKDYMKDETETTYSNDTLSRDKPANKEQENFSYAPQLSY